MAKKLTWLYGKRSFLFVVAVVAAALNAKCGVLEFHGVPWGFFDGG